MHDSPVGYRCPDCSSQSRPVFDDSLIVTKVLLGICFAIFLVQVVIEMGNGGGANAITRTSDNVIFNDGALQAYVMAQNGDWWRPITSGFLHSGLLHIALNGFFIYSFGQLLEPALGKLRFILLYFIGLLGGAAGALLLSDPLAATVGASGAGFGLLGAALVIARVNRDQAMAQQLMFLAGINFAFTFLAAGISVGGHVGGFLAGGVVGYLFYGPIGKQRPLTIGIATVMLVALYAASLIIAESRAPSVDELRELLGAAG